MIEFKGCTFSYSDKERWKFDGEFQSSKIAAFVGDNGSGKSTLMKLISGIEMFKSGSVYIENYQVDYSNKNSLRSIFFYVPQNPEWIFLKDSFLEHIKMIGRIYSFPLDVDTVVSRFSFLRDYVSMDIYDLPLDVQYLLLIVESYLTKRKVLLLDECPSFKGCKKFLQLLYFILTYRVKNGFYTFVSQHSYGFINEWELPLQALEMENIKL